MDRTGSVAHVLFTGEIFAADSIAATNPWFSWHYLQNNWNDIARALIQHVNLTWQAVLIALMFAVPLAILARRFAAISGWIIGASGVLYTVPSLALFAVLAPFTGIGATTVLIGLVAYALLVLVRNTLVGLEQVDPEVREAARGMGYTSWQVLFRIEFPIALPTIFAGVRMATVTTVALVTVGVVVGYGGLGQLLFRGFGSNYNAEVVTATLLCLLLAFAFDLALWALGRLLTPWARGRAGAAA